MILGALLDLGLPLEDLRGALGSLAVAPLLRGTTVLGALLAWSPRPGVFGAPALELLTQAAARVAPLLAATQAGPEDRAPAPEAR